MAAITLGGYFGFTNAGDELILYSHILRLRRAEPAKPITVLSRQPLSTASTYPVTSAQRWNPFACFLAFLRSDRFLLAGGGLLQESSGPFNHLYYLSLVLGAKAAGCHTELHAMGVDSMRSRWNRALTRWVLNHACDVLSVRDVNSIKVLRDIGVTREISIVADPVSALPVRRAPNAAPRIALVLSQPETPHLTPIIDHVNRLFERFQLPIDLLVFFPAQDEKLANAIKAFSAGIDRVRVPQAATDVLEWMGEYSLVIGSRFHALVLASSAGIPFMGWGTQEKVNSFCAVKRMPYLPNPERTSREALSLALESFRLELSFERRTKSDILESQTD